MSLAFNNTTTNNGIIQRIERHAGFPVGGISGNSTLLARFTGDANVALDEVLATIFRVGGTWQFDDSNHTDYPFITCQITSGQRDYPFVSDEQGNLILDIYKVMVADEDGLFREITPVDQQSFPPVGYYDGQDTTGQPDTYDKTGNGIILDPIPDYTRANSIKVFINREASYFTILDTTKKPGFAGLFHEYIPLKVSYDYCRDQQSPLAASLKNDLLEMRSALEEHYKYREKDVQKTLRAKSNNAR